MQPQNEQELLNAFIDGQLNSEQQQELLTRLANEPNLQSDLEKLQTINGALMAKIAEIDTIPAPQKVFELLAPESSTEQHSISSIQDTQPEPKIKSHRIWLAAASIAALGLLGVLTFNQATETDLNAKIEQALSTQISAQPDSLALAEKAAIQIALSFQHQNGHYCREYYLALENTFTRNVACFKDHWEIETTETVDAMPFNSGFRPAGEASHSNIDDFIDANILGNGLNAQKEKQLISQGWKAKSQ